MNSKLSRTPRWYLGQLAFREGVTNLQKLERWFVTAH